MAEHETSIAAEGTTVAVTGDFDADVAKARSLHHLASADPEIDGTLTGPAHEALYGLERAPISAEHWLGLGVDPEKNGSVDADNATEAPVSIPEPPVTPEPAAAAPAE